MEADATRPPACVVEASEQTSVDGAPVCGTVAHVKKWFAKVTEGGMT